MGFNRDNAVKYAEKYWNIPCDDGVICTFASLISVEQKRKELDAPAAAGWQAMFVDDGNQNGTEMAVFRRNAGGGLTDDKPIKYWNGLADCAHFLLRCLAAGGVTLPSKWEVGDVVQKLQDRSDTKTLCERVSRDRAQQVIDTGILKKGDMVGYWGLNSQGKLEYGHSAMYVGKIDRAKVGGVTCHTVSRFPPNSWVEDSWWLHQGYSYTLIHFSDDDDPKPNPAAAAALEGWWKLTRSGMTEYYYVFKDGRARSTNRAPQTAKDPLNVAVGTAYWFLDGFGKITFTWRKTGNVEVWSPGTGTNNYSSMITPLTPGVAAKLF